MSEHFSNSDLRAEFAKSIGELRMQAADILSKVADYGKCDNFPFEVTAEKFGCAIATIVMTAIQPDRDPREYLMVMISGMIHAVDQVEKCRVNLIQHLHNFPEV